MIARMTGTSEMREVMGLAKVERIRSAKTYDRSMPVNQPDNRNYQNRRIEQKDKGYEKGTKKFWERTQEIQASKGKKENDLIPKVLFT